MAPQSHRPGLSPGSRGRIGPYDIQGLLGQGGMAAVYLGKDSRDGREVAVKVLARMRPSWVQRFSREFEAARRVDHPNVVRVLEAGEHEGTAYFSMERIAGVTAQRYVLGLGASDPLPPAPPMEHSGPPAPISQEQVLRTLQVAVQLTRAVAAIHRVGLVHRDLKPGNVLVTPDGVVKLVDFGVAKWLEEQNQFTQVGHVVGSYSYMSPEQITGSEVDHRADMYGMGVLLYELLFGAPPFRARRPQEYLWLHCTAAPEPLVRRLDGMPAELDTLVQQMLAKEPADRPESMAIIERVLLDIQAEIEGRAAGAVMEAVATNEELPPLSTLEELPKPRFGEEGTLRSSDRELLELRRQARQARQAAPGTEATSEDPFAKLAASLSQELSAPGKPATPEPLVAPPTGEQEAVLTTRTVSQIQALEPLHPQVPRPSASSAALAALVTPRHVGRKDELDTLLADLKACRRQGVKAVLVAGAEGTGKTRLLQTFRGLAWVKGARVAIGRCHAAGAFCGPFHDIMLRLAGPGLARSHSEKILGPDRALLQHFFPALASRGVPPGVGGSLAAIEDSGQLFRAVGEAFRRAAADAPLVIGIEDVHQADGGTNRLILALLKRLGPPNPARVLFVLTMRPDEAKQGQLAHTLLTHPLVRQMALQPLTKAETEELIRSVTADVDVEPALLERLVTAAEGNPRFAVEAARSVVESGGEVSDEEVPRSLRAAFRSRLARLGKPAHDVARCVALLGDEPPLAIVQTASGLHDRAFSEAVSELERKRVCVVRNQEGERETISLASDTLRTTVLDALSASQERALHRRAAAAWLKEGGRSPETSGQAARHMYAAGEPGAAFPHALEAAYRAGQQLDYAAARRWMAQISQTAHDHLDAVTEEAAHRFQMLRFRLAFMDGDLDEAEEAISGAAKAAPDARSRLETGIALARFHTRTGNYLAAVQVARRGLREARRNEQPDLAVLFSIQGARAARRSGDLESTMAWLSEADTLLHRNQDLEALGVRVAWTRSAALLELRETKDAEPEIQRAILLARRTHQERAEAGLRTNLSVLYWRRGDMAGAVEQVEQARRIFEELGELDQVALTESNLAELRVRQGRLQEARELARSAWLTNRRLRDRQGTIVSAGTALLVARSTGDTVLGREVVRGVGEGPEMGRPLEAQWADYWLERARWHRHLGDGAEAQRCADRADDALGAEVSFRHHQLEVLRAELAWDRGQLDVAASILETLVPAAEKDGHRPLVWLARVIQGAVQAALGQRAELATPPPELLQDNVSLALATLFWHAAANDAQGRRGDAETLRERGRALARERGFADWLARFEGR